MQFVKLHWISLASGLVALLAIALGVLGMTRKGVQAALEARVSVGRQIDSLMGSPKNQQCIDAQKERGNQFEQEYQATRDMAATINRREPILDGVFPRPTGLDVAYRFQEVYRDKIYGLVRELSASGPPTPQEIQEERERLEEELRRRIEEGAPPPGGAAPPALGGPAAPPAPGGPAAPPTAPPAGWAAGLPQPAAAGGAAAPGDLKVEIPPGEAERQAMIRKAHSIRLYAESTPARTSFHISPLFLSEAAPSEADMWFAQVGLWVQQDIVTAVRKLNDAAAAGLQGEINVSRMPVKRIVGVRVHGYVRPGGELLRFDALTGGGGGVTPGASVNVPEVTTSFTERRGDEQFDVIRFSISVVVDQRDLLRLADAVVRENFYQLIGVEYDARSPALSESGYLYGDEPVVHALLNFEGYLARIVYKPMMPELVLTALQGTGNP